ncbi:MAG: glycosyltransferase family A protein, partial [Pyrinomonadaceae bacterium]
MSSGIEQHQAKSDNERAESSAPAISVVMPVHNALPFLDESIRSILNQSFTDFEFVILDDASTDDSGKTLREWAKKDERIRLHFTERKLGLSGSSNFVVSQSRAPLVARMDADDVSHPERLMRQWEVMRDCPEIILLGTLCEGIDAKGGRVRPRDRWRILRRSLFPPFPHGSVMFRRRAFDEAGGYREECVGWEDQELFLRMSERGCVAALPDALYCYRYHLNCTSFSALESPLTSNNDLQQLCLAAWRAGRDYEHLLENAESKS